MKYDEAKTSLKELKQRAKKLRKTLGHLEGDVRDAKASDQLYYLSKSSLRWLPLTSVQKVRVNAALGSKKDPTRFLSPGQRQLAKQLAAKGPAVQKKLAKLRPPTDPYRWAQYLSDLRKRLK